MIMWIWLFFFYPAVSKGQIWGQRCKLASHFHLICNSKLNDKYQLWRRMFKNKLVILLLLVCVSGNPISLYFKYVYIRIIFSVLFGNTQTSTVKQQQKTEPALNSLSKSIRCSVSFVCSSFSLLSSVNELWFDIYKHSCNYSSHFLPPRMRKMPTISP